MIAEALKDVPQPVIVIVAFAALFIIVVAALTTFAVPAAAKNRPEPVYPSDIGPGGIARAKAAAECMMQAIREDDWDAVEFYAEVVAHKARILSREQDKVDATENANG